MIEQALYLAIGFLVALFAAIVMVPVVSRRAFRFSGGHAGIPTPGTQKYAAVDRDSVLAAQAVGLARLAHQLSVAENDSMELRATVGRQAVRLAALNAKVAEDEHAIFDLRSELDKVLVERHVREAALATAQLALHDAFAQRDRAIGSEAAASARLAELDAEANLDRAKNAVLIAQAEKLTELLRSSEAEKAKAAKAILESSLASDHSHAEEPQAKLPRDPSERQHSSHWLEQAEVGVEKGRRRLAELELRLRRSKGGREESLIDRGREPVTLPDRDVALGVWPENAADPDANVTSGGQDHAKEGAGAVPASNAYGGQVLSASVGGGDLSRDRATDRQ